MKGRGTFERHTMGDLRPVEYDRESLTTLVRIAQRSAWRHRELPITG